MYILPMFRKTFTLSSDFLYNKRVLLVEVQND